jgi:hypothetical protein
VSHKSNDSSLWRSIEFATFPAGHASNSRP